MDYFYSSLKGVYANLKVLHFFSRNASKDLVLAPSVYHHPAAAHGWCRHNWPEKDRSRLPSAVRRHSF